MGQAQDTRTYSSSSFLLHTYTFTYMYLPIHRLLLWFKDEASTKKSVTKPSKLGGVYYVLREL